MEFNHVSVLLNECLEGLNIKENGIYVDEPDISTGFTPLIRAA